MLPARSILHLDADAFFASVEQAADPRLRGKPVAVGGEKRGIIASASYEARKFGVYTPMPTVQARRLCPRLIILAGDFAKYDAIVTGVRAYNARPRMRLAHPKLMEYVKNGGTLVVQYNSTNPQPLLVDVPGPYPFKVTTERVTVEEAPVRFVHPDSPLLNVPNKITQADFSGWVQERGLNFVKDWDPQYQTVLASNDPGEPEKEGGELYAHYGKGTFVYTSYAWFRQLPAGVPGAYKMFVNLVSAK